MIPCKECLVLALCKHKIEIDCPLLYNWVERKYNKQHEKEVDDCFPNLGYFHLGLFHRVYFHYYIERKKKEFT